MSRHPDHPYCKRSFDLKNKINKCQGWNNLGQHFDCNKNALKPLIACPTKNLDTGKYEGYCLHCYRTLCEYKGWHPEISICANKKAQEIDKKKTVFRIMKDFAIEEPYDLIEHLGLDPENGGHLTDGYLRKYHRMVNNKSDEEDMDYSESDDDDVIEVEDSNEESNEESSNDEVIDLTEEDDE